MAEHPSLAEAMGAAARELRQHESVDALLDDGVAVACREIDSCDGAAVSIVQKKVRIDTPAATGPEAQRSDELQYELGEGPCLDAIWTQQTVHIRDFATEGRWPAWGDRMAAEVDFHSMVAFQLYTSADNLGALNVYSRTVDAFTAEDIAYGQALAAHLAVALAAARKIDQLDEALLARTNIGIATGIIMARYDLDRDRAFAVLTRVSSTTNTKLRDIAAQVAAGGPLPGVPGQPDPGDDGRA